MKGNSGTWVQRVAAKPYWMLLIIYFGLANIASAEQLPDFTKLVEQYSAAVVSITAEVEPQRDQSGPQFPFPENNPFFDYFRRFFEEGPGAPPMQPETSLGSGFIISHDGYVLTNAHVLSNATNITVVLPNQREYKAKVVGQDELTDIALIKLEGKNLNLPVTELGDSSTLKVGQWVLAIGSPFGLEHTATQGIVSGLGRSLPTDTYVPFIQTDAAVNPGNSGGPLFSLDGKVIGINSLIYTESGGYMGVSFAIPINVAMDVVQQLKTKGHVTRGWLGVQIQDVTSDLAKSFGLKQPGGALIAQVLPDSPAAKSQLQVGDIIVSFNGQKIQHSGQLPPLVGRTKPGTTVPITVVREGKERTIKVTIEELPRKEAHKPATQPPASRLGIKVEPLPPGAGKQSEGVLVTSVTAGPAARAGIQPGDIILRIGTTVITSVDQFHQQVAALPEGKPIPILVRRQGTPLFLTVTIPTK